MRVLDPGHRYELAAIDSGRGLDWSPEEIRFVKRIGPEYPGNLPPDHGGTTIQEVLRVLIDRLEYVDQQRPCPETQSAAAACRTALLVLEIRVRRERGQPALDFGAEGIERRPTCGTCGHVACLTHQA